jgi:hypothetical protein
MYSSALRKWRHFQIRHFGASALLLALATGMVACSDSPAEPGSKDAAALPDSGPDANLGDAPSETDLEERVDTGSDAGPDVRPDVVVPDGGNDAGDGRADACSSAPIWPSNAEGFTYDSSGGFVAQPPPDAGCTLVSTTYVFVASAKTLSQRGCQFTGRIDRTVYLTDAQTTQILANLEALRTSCPSNPCGADYPDVAITIRTAAGQSTQYDSDFYAECSGSIVSPPFVSYQSLATLQALLNTIVTAACQPDAGGADAGTCVQGDGGSSDAGDAGG